VPGWVVRALLVSSGTLIALCELGALLLALLPNAPDAWSVQYYLLAAPLALPTLCVLVTINWAGISLFKQN
jgi:hypothetical protein